MNRAAPSTSLETFIFTQPFPVLLQWNRAQIAIKPIQDSSNFFIWQLYRLAYLGHAFLRIEVLVTYYFMPDNALLECRSIIVGNVGKSEGKFLVADSIKTC